MSAARVLSLLPSSTEIACALGARRELVGRSHECDHPPGIEALPVVTAPRMDPAGDSASIDRDVRQLVAGGLSIYRVDAERVQQLRPDVVLTQTLCDVCAVTPGDLAEALAGWIGARPELVALAPLRLADVLGDIERIGGALGRSAAASELVTAIRQRMRRAGAIAGDRPVRDRPRVLALEWLDPLMSGGNWMPELLQAAGAEALLAEAGAHSAWIEPGQIVAADPDVVLLLPCGLGLRRTLGEWAALREREPFAGLRAAREGRVYALDGHSFFNRPGPRLADSLEILVEILHPGAAPPRYRGSAWREAL